MELYESIQFHSWLPRRLQNKRMFCCKDDFMLHIINRLKTGVERKLVRNFKLIESQLEYAMQVNPITQLVAGI